MVAVMLMSVALIGLLCFVAYTLATYALPFMLGITAARFAYDTGSGLIGAGLVGLTAGAVAFGLLVFLFASLRPPILRLGVALVTPWSMASPRKPSLRKCGGKSSASSARSSSASRR
jgi:hypothetical protein